MKYNIRSAFISFLFALILSISSQARDRDSLECESPSMVLIYKFQHWNENSVDKALKSAVQKYQLTESKAKGLAGEKAARSVVENRKIPDYPFESSPYISIFTLFREWGCTITPLFRNTSDNGLDDAFIMPQENKWNNAYSPVFHEAKYAANGRLRLGKNTRSCDQLSIGWIKGHLYTAQNKGFESAWLCFPSTNRVQLKMPVCNSCNKKIYSCIEWLNKQFDVGNFYRTASVLDKEGALKFYLAEKD